MQSWERNGSILIHDNLVATADLVSIVPFASTWNNIDRLRTQQLQPKASYSGIGTSGGLDISLSSRRRVGDYAVCLLGTSVGFANRIHASLNISTGVGSSITNTNIDNEVYILQGPDDTVHLILVMDHTMDTAFDLIRITWEGSGALGDVGSLYVGRVRQEPCIVGQGWSIGYTDNNDTLRSYGGQIYNSQEKPGMARQVRAPFVRLDTRKAFAAPHHTQHTIPIEHPGTISGSVTHSIASGERQYQVTGSNSGTITFTGALAGLSGRTVRMDYYSWVYTGSVGGDAAFQLGAGNTSRNAAMINGKGSLIFDVGSDNLVINANATGASTRLIIRELSVVEDGGPEFSMNPTSPDSLDGIYRRHGSSRPVILMGIPSNPNWNEHTGIYGYIQQVPTIDHISSIWHRSDVVITEQR